MTVPPYADHNLHIWPPGKAMDWHRHAFFQIIQVLDGLLEVDWGEGWQPVTPGRAHILPPGHRHRLRSLRGHRQFGLNCTERRDERGMITALGAAFSAPNVVTVPTAAVPVLRITAVHDEAGPLATLRWQSMLDGYVLAVLSAAAGHGQGSPARRLLDHLLLHVDRPIMVEAVGRAIGLGRAATQRLCQQAFGGGVAHVHERLRLDRAARRLMEEDLSITAAATASGYDDIFQFSRAFRRVQGLSPLAWKRRQAQRSG